MHRSISIVAAAWAATCKPADDSHVLSEGGSVGTAGESAGETDGERLDVGGGQEGTADDGGGMGCSKVDFVFVVDDSGSMAQEQANLAASFPGFIAAIEATLDTDDYHVMVVDSDDNPWSGCIDEICAGCDPPSGCSCGDGNEFTNCEEILGSTGTPCDDTLGAGVVAPRGNSSSAMDCMIAGGGRFIAQGQPDLSDTFACIATVGTSGDSDERPMGALGAALSPGLLGAGECNEGFLRADAILVVAIVTDAGPESSTEAQNGDPGAWRQALIDAKGGDAGAIAVLGVISDGDQPGGLCPDVQPGNWDGQSPVPNPKIRQLVESFDDRGVLASICEPDYAPFFVDAVATVIDQTCEEFIPPG